MRKYLIRETAQDPTATIINAPKDELELFNNPPLSSVKGTIVNLCNGPNGNPKQYRAGGKTYTVAKKTEKGNYVTYDGKVLQKVSECKFQYLLKNGQIAIIKGGSEQGLDTSKDKILSQFGIAPNNPETDVYYQLGEITKQLQNIINQGGVSPLFKIWNNLIEWYYPNSYKENVLKPIEGKTFEVPTDKQEVQNSFRVADASRYGINYNGKPFTFYIPKDANKNQIVDKSKKTAQNCTPLLLNYILNGIETRVGSSTEATETQSMKSDIVGCYKAGVYEKDNTSFDTNTLNPQVLQKFSPYRRKFLGGFRSPKEKLSFKDIKKLLNSDAVGPNHKVDLDNPGGGGGYDNPNLKEHVLRMSIKQTLLELHEKKKDETQIIKERFNFLVEGKTPKTVSSQSKFLMSLIRESNDLRYLGFSDELLNEQLMDVVKTSLGGLAGGTVDYLKERITRTLLNKLGPNVADTWVGGAIVMSVGNIPLGDIFKSSTYTCEYMVPLIAKSIVENAVKRTQDKAGLKNPFFDILRNAIIDGIDNTQFAQSIEGGLEKLLCPVITQIGSNLGGMVKKGLTDAFV